MVSSTTRKTQELATGTSVRRRTRNKKQPQLGSHFFRLFPGLFVFCLVTTSHSCCQAYSLQGKRALVTGSSGGIGKAIALELARNKCQVIVHYNLRQQGAQDTCREINELCDAHPQLCPAVLQADFCDPLQIHSLIRFVDDVWPDGWDILINNAGVVSKLAMEDDDDEFLTNWHETLQVNLHAPRLLSHLAVPRMRKVRTEDNNSNNNNDNYRESSGVIINISSIHGEKSNEYMSSYAVSKSALDMLTRSMALEYAVYNIRANAVAPGVVPVERTAEAFLNPATVQQWTDRLPLRRLGTVQEIAHTTVAMITNDWVTGAIWQVDGGMMARSNMPQRPRPLKEGGLC